MSVEAEQRRWAGCIGGQGGRSISVSRLGVAALLAAVIFSATAVAHADDEPAPLDVRLSSVEGAIAASFDVTSAFTEVFRKRVLNGLRSTIIVEVLLHAKNGDVVGRGLRTCHFKLDVWDDVLSVRILESSRKFEQGFSLIDRGLRQCGLVEELRLTSASLFDNEREYWAEVVVLLNPVDQETLQSAREFMSNPRGTRESRPSTFFGAVARLFSSETDTGGEEFVFRSGWMARPRRVP